MCFSVLFYERRAVSSKSILRVRNYEYKFSSRSFTFFRSYSRDLSSLTLSSCEFSSTSFLNNNGFYIPRFWLLLLRLLCSGGKRMLIKGKSLFKKSKAL